MTVLGELTGPPTTCTDLLKQLADDRAHFEIRYVPVMGDVADIVEQIRGRYGARIVLTSGSFDVIHEGHSMYLEAARSMGASRSQIVRDVLIVEAKPGLVSSITIMTVSFISYSAMAGLVGGGGIGDFAIRYGYYRYETPLMIAAIVLMILLVTIVQLGGSYIARRLDKRL